MQRLGRYIGSAAFRAALAVELGLVAIAASVYVLVRELTEGSPARAMENAQRLVELEQRLGIAWERAIHDVAVQHDWLRTLANWVYIWGHWPVIIAVGAWLYIHRRDRYRWLRNAMFASGLIGFAFFALVPMAPPRLAGLGFIDTVTTWSSSYRVLQPPGYANLYAAMPSLHFGWDLLVGIALFSSTTVLALRVFALVMPTLMAFAVVATANHWVLDVVVGLLVVSAGVAVSEGCALRDRRRDAAELGVGEPVRESA